jgi:hypothetical protein
MKQFRGLAGKFGLSPEEILKVKRWIMSFEIVSHIYCRKPLPGIFWHCSFLYSSDILRAVIMRTKVLLLHLLEGTDFGVRISDVYDIFQVNPNTDPNLNLNLNPNPNPNRP